MLESVLSLQAELFGDKSLKRISKMGFQDLDMTNDMLVEFLHGFGRDPEFLVLGFANRVLFELTDVLLLHLELGNVPCKLAIFRIPVGSRLAGIVKVKDRIEYWLLRQARRESLHAAVIDLLQFLQTNWAIKINVLAGPPSKFKMFMILSCSRRYPACLRRGNGSCIHFSSSLTITLHARIKQSQAARN